MGQPKESTKLIKDALRRFDTLPSHTIAKYLLYQYGNVFGNNLELIRSKVRYYRGANGQEDRTKLGDNIIPRTELPSTQKTERSKYPLPVGLHAFFPDIHVPFHEPVAIESAVAFAKANNVDGVVFPGDLQDCASVSYWPTSRKRDFDSELESTIDFLDFIDHEFEGKKKVYKMGNHEYRLDRYYQNKAPDLLGIPMLAIEAVLRLEDRGYAVVEPLDVIMAGELPIFHGHEVGRLQNAVNPARGLFLKLKSWGMCAHVHRTSQHSERNIRGDLLTTWSMGCLCNLSPEYDPYANNWNWGFALVNVEKDGNFEVENRRILPNGKVV